MMMAMMMMTMMMGLNPPPGHNALLLTGDRQVPGALTVYLYLGKGGG